MGQHIESYRDYPGLVVQSYGLEDIPTAYRGMTVEGSYPVKGVLSGFANNSMIVAEAPVMLHEHLYSFINAEQTMTSVWPGVTRLYFAPVPDSDQLEMAGVFSYGATKRSASIFLRSKAAIPEKDRDMARYMLATVGEYVLQRYGDQGSEIEASLSINSESSIYGKYTLEKLIALRKSQGRAQ